MKRDLETLTRAEFDLVVIGGGIFGVWAALDAAQRGLSVALIERGDFAGATSANSFKVVHGGIRYLQHADIFRVRQSSRERAVLLNSAPHMIRPLPIAVPTYGHAMKGQLTLRAGMGVYDLLTLDRNRGIVDPSRRIPRGYSIGRDEALDMFPGLHDNGLTGAAIFCDGQIQNPPRLVFAVLQRAVEYGACAANYVEATGFVQSGNRVTGVNVRDLITGVDFRIDAKVVLNAAGPYAEQLLKRADSINIKPAGNYSRDACFVVQRSLLNSDCALAVQGQTQDPDAIVSRGARHLFVVPWRDYTLVGVWHVIHSGDPNKLHVADDELEDFIGEVNAGYPALGLTLDDVGLWNCGLVPFGENAQDATNLRYGHRSRLVDHAKTDNVHNLVTLIGVRFTTGRYESAYAVDMVCRKLNSKTVASQTYRTSVAGGDFDDLPGLIEQASRQFDGLAQDVVKSIVGHYGSEYKIIADYITRDSAMSDRIGKSSIIRAQVRHAARHEMVSTLADVVFRRTDLATGSYPGKAALQQCADMLAEDFDWNEDQVSAEIDQVTSRFPAHVISRADSTPTV